MKPLLITLAFALGTLTVASTLVPKTSNSVLDHTVIVSDDDPPPICPPICSDDSSNRPIIVHQP